MNYFEGDLVRLRALEPADAPFFFEWNRHSDMPRHLDGRRRTAFRRGVTRS